MNVGLDVGYSATKAWAGPDREPVYLDSAVGTPDQARWSLNGPEGIILEAPDHVLVGREAVKQSRFLKRREDRRWIESDEWYHLFLAALTETTGATVVELRIVTGLPVAHYEAGHLAVRDRLLGDHRAKRPNRRAQLFKVTEARVIPQPFGCLLATCLDDRGAIVDQGLATSKVGVVDVGGKTTNLLSVNQLAEIAAETDSVNVGAWDVVRAVRRWLATTYPDLNLRDHELVDAIINRRTAYYGDPVDLSAIVGETLEPMADEVLAAASQMWNGGAGLDAVLISGGGALLLGPYIAPTFNELAGRGDFARVVDNPVFANARGFWRFAQRVERGL